MVRLAGIEYDSIVDGPGLRTAIFVQGCGHHCKGCHNPQTWDFNSGTEISINELVKKIEKNSINKNVTLTGGDPVYQWKELYPFVMIMIIHGYSFMLYTGFTTDELINPIKSKIITDSSDEKNFYKFISSMDLVCTEPFIEKEKDLTLVFRGSKNQLIGDFVYQYNTIRFRDSTQKYTK